MGDRFYISGCAGEMGALLNGRAWTVVAGLDASHFRIDAVPRAVAAFAGCSGGTTRSAPPAAPAPPVVPPVNPAPTRPAIYFGGSGQFGGKAWY
ncbi:hypothetical protein [Sinorhizobium meliloti]|uniref:hypothetical protein n=1 Tax=Rhizobium meliloti TaxID=382 RepID=UPI0030AC7162